MKLVHAVLTSNEAAWAALMRCRTPEALLGTVSVIAAAAVDYQLGCLRRAYRRRQGRGANAVMASSMPGTWEMRLSFIPVRDAIQLIVRGQEMWPSPDS